MGVGDWYREKEDAQRAYDMSLIDIDLYETRTKFAIGMIYKCGSKNDKKTAERIAKAHNYDIKELIEMVK